MKRNRYQAQIVVLFSLVIASSGDAQVVSSVNNASQETEKPIVLSPFTVDESETKGYYAPNTLAGTRIKSSLKDIASSVQVVTSEFLADTGATNIQDILIYTTNTEVGGDGGNYSGVSISATNDIPTDLLRAEPHLTTRVRGLFKADLTRDYFKTVIPTDSYITDRVEINRGSNAILYGLGSPAGIVNTSLVKANFRNAGKVSVRVGEHASIRGELDLNRIMVPDKFALRVATVVEERNYRQKPAYEDHERLFATGTWRPFPNTIVRGRYERGRIDSNRPDPLAPKQNIDTWLLGDKPLHHAGIGEFTPQQMPFIEFPDGRRVPYRGVRVDLNGDGVLDVVPPSMIADNTYGLTVVRTDGTLWNEGRFFVAPNGQVSAPPYPLLPHARATGPVPLNTARFAQQFSAVWTNPTFRDPDFPGFVGTSPATFHVAGDALNRLLGRPANAPLDPAYALGGDGDANYSDFTSTRELNAVTRGFNGSQGFVSPKVFDWARNLLSGTGSWQNQDFDNVNVSVEQNFFNNSLGFELAIDRQNYRTSAFAPYENGTAVIWMDINFMLPDGRFNPNVGRPYVVARRNAQYRVEEQLSKRATAYWDLNFERVARNRWAKWLGRHVFTGFVSEQKLDTTEWSKVAVWNDADIMRVMNTPTDIRHFNNQVQAFVYIGPSLLDVPSITELSQLGDVRLPPLQPLAGVKLWRDGETAPVTYWDPGVQPGSTNLPATSAGGADVIRNQGRLVTKEVGIIGAVSSASIVEETLESYAAVWQSHFLKNHIVGTLGFRSDKVMQTQFNNTPSDTVNNLLLNRIKQGGVSDRQVIETDRVSWGVVGHLPERIKLPFNSSLSAHYGESSNFQPVAGVVDYKNRIVESPNGETKEMGISLSMFGGKLYTRLNQYRTALAGRVVAGNFDGLERQLFIDGSRGNFERAMEVEGLNPGLAAINRAIGLAIYNAMTPGEADRLRPTLTFNNGVPTSATHQRTALASDTEDVVAKGSELELVYNPTPNLRLMVNVGHQKTIRDNTYPVANAELIPEREAFLATPVPGYEWLRLGQTQFQGAPLGSGTFDIPNRIYQLAPGAETLDQYVARRLDFIRDAKSGEGSQADEQREWRFNFIANYEFSRGRLKGFGVGGAYRWQSKAVVGYDTKPNAIGVDIADITKPFYDDGRGDTDLWIRYKMPFFRDRLKWTVQLNVRNAFTSADEVIVVRMQGDGVTPQRAMYAPPRTFFLTNTITF